MEVKKGMEKEYKKYLKINTSFKREIWASDILFGKKRVTSKEWMDLCYNASIIAASEAVGAALTAGKKPKEAEKWMNHFGLSIFQAGCVARTVCHFHQRGDEFLKYWNKQFGESSIEGVVNPAVLKFKPKESKKK